MRRKVFPVALVMTIVLSIPMVILGQERADTTRAGTNQILQQKRQAVVDTTADVVPGELVLGEINIEAIIEKPNVDIIPKRRKPKVEEIAFIDRSFAPEIREIPKDFHLYDKELDAPKKLDKLLKALEKKAEKKK